MTRFHKTWLPHTQNQTHDFTWNELLVQYPFIIHCTLPSRMASLAFTVAFLWPCNIAMSEQLAPFSCQDLVGMSCGELCLLSELANINFTQFNVIVVEWLQKAQTWPLDSNRLGSPLYIPMLSPPTASTHHPYYYHLWYYHPFKKSYPKHGIFSVSETYTPTQW